MEITKKAEYAINALVELAVCPEEFISSKEIALRQHIPPNFLPQIIATLGTKGWVEGVRGPGGGVKLVVAPGSISVREVVELIEGPVAITRCLAHGGSCSKEGQCPLHGIWGEAQEAFLKVLSSTSIADVVKIKNKLDNNGK